MYEVFETSIANTRIEDSFDVVPGVAFGVDSRFGRGLGFLAKFED